MSLDDFSTVIVAGEGPALTQVGFGTLGILAHFPASMFGGDLSTVVTSKAALTGTEDDPLLDSNHPAVIALERALQQSPQPSPIKMLRMTAAPVPSIRLTPAADDATVYSFTLELVGKSPVDISITSDEDGTVDEICDAIELAIEDLDDSGEDLEGLVVTASGATATHLDLSMAAGNWFYIRDWNHDRIDVEDRTPDPGVDANLSAIRAVDADWYHLGCAHNSKAITKEVADWAETQRVLFGCSTSDSNARDTGETGDIQSLLDAVSYARTICIFDKVGTDGMAGVAMMAERAPFDPGSPPHAGGDFNAKTLTGVPASNLTPDEKADLRSKGYTVIETTAGRVHTLGGDAAGGKPMDQTRFEDWFAIRLQERFAALTLNNDRVPMSKVGLAMYESECRAQIQAGITAGGILAVDSLGLEPTVSVPTLGQIPSNERSARLLGGPGIVIEYTYSGAIREARCSVFVKL